ncbi:class I SAM-dependent methyltransferase, partial [Helicobacter cinaedi]
GGAMLNSLSQAYPKSSLYAYDVSSHNKHIFENLPQFVAFYDELDSINERFDCISLIHCLEHIINVREILLRLKTLLSENGVLLIQVPDVSQDKWDIFTYDHCHHFSPFTLRALLESCGFEVYIPQMQIDRQITIVGKKAQCKLSIPSLLSHIQVLENLKSEDSALSVFGTTNRSTLIGGILGDRLECFIDEDERKVGKTHLDKPIMTPQERFKNAYKDVKCIIPLGDTLTQRMQNSYPYVECVGLS